MVSEIRTKRINEMFAEKAEFLNGKMLVRAVTYRVSGGKVKKRKK
jgi:hypothetical protein